MPEPQLQAQPEAKRANCRCNCDGYRPVSFGSNVRIYFKIFLWEHTLFTRSWWGRRYESISESVLEVESFSRAIHPHRVLDVHLGSDAAVSTIGDS